MKKIGIIILKSFIFIVAWGLLISISFFDFDNTALQRFMWELEPFTVIVLITWIFVKFIEKNLIKIAIWKNIARNTLLGIVIGIVWLGGSVSILTISGAMQIQSSNAITYLPLWFVSVLLNTIMQELLVRGYLYQLIKKNYNSWTAMIVTTLLFVALHGGAFETGLIPVLNVLTMSVFVTLLLEYTGTLLAPIIVHFLWNAIGCLVLGAVSLADDYPHIMNTVFSGNAIISGGVYKLEGSIVVLIANVLLISYTLYMMRKNRNAVIG